MGLRLPQNAETHLAGVLSRHTLIRSVRSYQYPVAQICALFSDLNAFAGVLSLSLSFQLPSCKYILWKALGFGRDTCGPNAGLDEIGMIQLLETASSLSFCDVAR